MMLVPATWETGRGRGAELANGIYLIRIEILCSWYLVIFEKMSVPCGILRRCPGVRFNDHVSMGRYWGNAEEEWSVLVLKSLVKEIVRFICRDVWRVLAFIAYGLLSIPRKMCVFVFIRIYKLSAAAALKPIVVYNPKRHQIPTWV